MRKFLIYVYSVNAIFSCCTDRGGYKLKKDKVDIYIESLIAKRPAFFLEMELYADENKIPIMEISGMEAMIQFLRIKQPKKILEIGTAIGYSALRMAHALPNTKIVTIERDEERAHLADQYFQQFDHNGQIHLVKGDALEAEELARNYGPYDAVFIDAAKGQYKKFFELYSRFVNEQGIIITDNVLFKGLVAEEAIQHKRTDQLVKKIKVFNEWLMSQPDYYTIILPVGDGVAISQKR